MSRKVGGKLIPLHRNIAEALGAAYSLQGLSASKHQLMDFSVYKTSVYYVKEKIHNGRETVGVTQKM